MPLGLNLPKNSKKSLTKMAEKMKEMQNKLASIEEKEYEGNAGGGKIKVIANGKLRIVKISISPEFSSDLEAIEDLVQVAANEALSKAIDEKERISNSATTGLDINGLF
ncbi:MAG: YbaB/EbfC family nucleoid-associated protein [Clostridia bacterium]|nr:YbaB/EbfC family nucleoid-associated protein [Clostridia bacterium]